MVRVVVVAALALLGWRTLSERPTETVEPTGVAAPEQTDVAAGCTRAVEALLAEDLRAALLGRPDLAVDVRAELVKQYGAASPVLAQVDKVHAEVLTTAMGDLFGRYDRRAAALQVAYRSRIAMACQQL